MNIERVIKFTSVAASRVGAVGCLLLAAAAAPGAIAASVAGDSWAYRVINGYNNEVRGNIRYRIDKVEADRVVVAFTNDAVLLGQPRMMRRTWSANSVSVSTMRSGAASVVLDAVEPASMPIL